MSRRACEIHGEGSRPGKFAIPLELSAGYLAPARRQSMVHF
jgi:hypothetical protein